MKFHRIRPATCGPSGRSPYGERGLKLLGNVKGPKGDSRSPYGERGLKCSRFSVLVLSTRRSPYGERGLKSLYAITATATATSLSLRRAWIEIQRAEGEKRSEQVALLTESVD